MAIYEFGNVLGAIKQGFIVFLYHLRLNSSFYRNVASRIATVIIIIYACVSDKYYVFLQKKTYYIDHAQFQDVLFTNLTK